MPAVRTLLQFDFTSHVLIAMKRPTTTRHNNIVADMVEGDYSSLG